GLCRLARRSGLPVLHAAEVGACALPAGRAPSALRRPAGRRRHLVLRVAPGIGYSGAVYVNGTELWVEDTGSPHAGADTIVFSHPLLFPTGLFAPQIAALGGRYRCVAYDHRGQGKSAPSRLRCISMELLYQDAVALIEALGAGPVHFVGLSMGGFVGMRVAAR